VGEPDSVVVRPSPARLRRILLLAIPAVALTLLPAFADETGLTVVTVVLLLVLAPVLAGVVMTFRNKRLAQRGGDLVYADWRGREQVVPGGDIASAGFVLVVYATEGGTPDERLVIERRSAAPPLVVGVSSWDQYEIRRLLAGLGVQVQRSGLALTRRQLRENLPGYRPPVLERHPFLAALAIMGVILGVVAVIVGIAG
jgi:hypothetical protein